MAVGSKVNPSTHYQGGNNGFSTDTASKSSSSAGSAFRQPQQPGNAIQNWGNAYVEGGGNYGSVAAPNYAAIAAAIENTNKRRENDAAIAANAQKAQKENEERYTPPTPPTTLEGLSSFSNPAAYLSDDLDPVMTDNTQSIASSADAFVEDESSTPTVSSNNLVGDDVANSDTVDLFERMASEDFDSIPEIPAFETSRFATPSNTTRLPDGRLVNDQTGEVGETPAEALDAEVDRVMAESSEPDYNSARYHQLESGEYYDLSGKTPFQVQRDMERLGLNPEEALAALSSYTGTSETYDDFSQSNRRDNSNDQAVNAVPPRPTQAQNAANDPGANATVPPVSNPPTGAQRPTNMPPAPPRHTNGSTGSTVGGRAAPGSSNRDYEDRAARRIKRIVQHVVDVQADLRAGYYLTTEDEFDQQTGVVTTRSPIAVAACDQYLRRTRNATPSERARRIAWMQTQKLAGVSLDRYGRFAKRSGNNKTDAEENEEIILTPEEVARLFEEMIVNIKKFGTPYHMPRGSIIKIHGKDRYCIPIPTMEEYRMLSAKGGCWENVSYEDVVQQGVDEWNNFVHPRLLAAADPSQIIAVEDMMRATIEMCNGAITHEDVHVLPSDAMHLKEVEDRNVRTGTGRGSELLNEAISTAQNKREGALQRINRRNGHSEITRNPDGSIDIDEFHHGRPENAFISFIRMFLSGVRTASIIDPLLMGTSLAEKAQGSAIYRGWRGWEWSRMGLGRGVAETYRPTEATFNAARYNEDAMKALELYSYLNDVDGYDFLMAFTATDTRPTDENIQEFAQTYVRSHPGKASSKLLRLADKGIQFSAKAWGGDWILRGSDMTNFIDIFMINQVTRNQRDGTPVMYTREQLEQAFRLDPVEAIQSIMSTFDGVQAFYTMKKRTLAGSTIFTEPIKQWFRNHPMLDLLFVTTTGQKFLNFNLKAIRQWIPMMNTMELFAMNVRAGRLNQNFDDVRFAELLTSTDYKQALRMDMAYMTSNALKICMWMLLISVCGLQPPDDEDKMGMWDEYRIGKSPENSVPIRMSWYLDDSTTWTLPVTMAIWGTTFGFGDKKLTRKQALDIIVDGSSDMIGGSIFGGLSSLLKNFDVELINAQKANDSYEAEQAQLIDNLDAFNQRLAVVGVDAFADLISPRWINDLINYGIVPSEDNIAHSYTMRYTENPNDDPLATEPIDSNMAEIQKIAHDHPIFGLLWNLYDIAFNDALNPSRQWTGHMASQMPAKTVTDPVGLYWVNTYNIDGHRDENGVFIREEDDEITNQKCNEIKELIEKYPDPAQLAALGVCLPYEIRYYTSKMLREQKDQVWKEYNDAKATPGYFGAGLDYYSYKEASNKLYDETKDQADYLQSLIDILWSHDIPYSPHKMVSLATDYQQILRDSEGNIITEPEALMRQLFGEEVTKEFRNYGNLKTALPFPWIVGHRQEANGNRTFDDQSPVSWFDAGISMEQLKEIYQDKFVPIGSFAGQNCFDLLTADGRILTAVEGSGIDSTTPLFGDRGYVAYEDVYPFDDSMKDDDKYADGKTESDTEDEDDASSSNNSGWGWTSYPSRKYYSRGSYGGSGYNPKIYSNSRSVNADRATTMRANRPYSKTGRTYLNPNFETKGSREAYKRGDF